MYVVVDSITRHTVVTSKDTTSDIAVKGNARLHMGSDITDNIFTWDDILYEEFAIVRLGTVWL